jgi:hypothetical protein
VQREVLSGGHSDLRDQEGAERASEAGGETGALPGQLLALQQTAGNAAVSRMLRARGHAQTPSIQRDEAPPPAPDGGNAPAGGQTDAVGPAAWSELLVRRKRPITNIPNAARSSEGDALEIFEGDTVTFKVTLPGLTEATHADYRAFATLRGATTGAGESTPDMSNMPDSTFTGTGYEWDFVFDRMGHYDVSVWVDGPQGRHDEQDRTVTVYGDIQDMEEALSATDDALQAVVLDADAGLSEATEAFKSAYEEQKKELDKEAKDRQMEDDLLYNALFAGLGGIGGGVIGKLGEYVKSGLAGGLAIDCAKDVEKSVIKSASAMGHSMVGEVQLTPASPDPLNFLLKHGSAAKSEASKLFKMVETAKDYAHALTNAQKPVEFDADPRSLLEQSKSLQFIRSPKSADKNAYTRSLWSEWLGKHGYVFVAEHLDSRPGAGMTDFELVDVPASIQPGVDPDSSFEEFILNAARSSGMSDAEARAWYEEARRPALEAAQKAMAASQSAAP